MRIVTVLRTGGEYTTEHVAAFARNLKKHHPNLLITCITDIDVGDGELPSMNPPILFGNPPVEHNWPGWWMKMNIFDPNIDGDILYVDLDTVIVGSIFDLIQFAGRDVVLRDFYRGGAMDGKPRVGHETKPRIRAIGSGLMLLRQDTRAKIWGEWIRDPEGLMVAAGPHGDQRALEIILARLGLEVDFWQDILHPGKVCSYKADILHHGLKSPPEGASVVCFHGKPRPWAVNDEWVRDARA